MAGVNSTKTWVKFFTEAGIPDAAAATYALTFVENRIRCNMLLELNKEYLRDMGITLMGDVIAILRHAKNVHEQQAREKVLSTNPRIQSTASKTDLSHGSEEDESTSKKPSPGFRVHTNDHNVPKLNISSYEQEARTFQPVTTCTIRAPGIRVNTNNDNHMYEEGTSSHKKEARVPATFTGRVPEKKKRAIAQVKCQPTTVRPFHSDEEEEMDLIEKDFYVPASSVQTTAATTISTANSKPPPPKKSKIVISSKKATPEHTAVSKKNVFERLGGEKSNTPVPSTGSVSSITKGSITITCNTSTALRTKRVSTTPSIEKKSVFARLGNKTNEKETAPNVDKISPQISPMGPALPYAGILKQTTPPSTVPKKKVVKKIITMRADEPKVPVHLRAKSPKQQTVVKKKIAGGIPVIRRTVSSNGKQTVIVSNKTNTQGILGNYINSSKVNVKQRLGTSQTVKLVPQKQLIHVEKEEYEDDSEPFTGQGLDMDNNGGRFSMDGLQSKKVTFGGVTQKSIPGRLGVNSPIKPVGSGSITMRTGVFSRLGMTAP